MGSHPKHQDDVIPIDVYTALQRKYLMEPALTAELRRNRAFSDMTANEAVKVTGQLLDTFGPPLTKQLLLSGQLHLHRIIAHVEPRAALLMNACDELGQTDVLRMMVRASPILATDDMTFTALLDGVKRLVPDRKQRGIFLFAFPQYFALPPVKVSEFVALGETSEKYRNDHLLLWSALVIHCVKEELGVPSEGTRTVIERVAEHSSVPEQNGTPSETKNQPSPPEKTEQKATVVSYSEREARAIQETRTVSVSKPVRTDQAGATLRLCSGQAPGVAHMDICPTNARPAAAEMPTPKAEMDPSLAKVLQIFDDLRYNYVRSRHIANRLRRELGSWRASLSFVDTLVRAGWKRQSLTLAMAPNKPFRKIGLDRVLELHSLLVNTFGLNPSVAAYTLSHRHHLLGLTARQLDAAIKMLLPGHQTAAVEHLLNLPAHSFRWQIKLDIGSRESALGTDKTMQGKAIADQGAETYRGAETAPLPGQRRRRGQKIGLFDARNQILGPEPTIHPKPDPVFASVFEAIKAAGWTERDALNHLRIFSGLKDLEPAQVNRSLTRLKGILGLAGKTFTERLNANTRRLVFDRDALIAVYHSSAHGKRSTYEDAKGRLTREQSEEARRLAVSIHSLDPYPRRNLETIREAIGVLQMTGLSASASQTFLAAYPELLADDARPLAVLSWLMSAYRLEPERMRENLHHPDSRMALFLQPDALKEIINAHRLLALDYDELRIPADFLDPCHDWKRAFCPTEELAFRLELLHDLGERPGTRVLNRLHAPRAAFLRAVEEQKSGKQLR